MATTIVTTKGQIVIPAKIRRSLNIRKGMKLYVIEERDQIILRPLNEDYFERMAGILKTKGKLTRALLREREREKEAEEKRWSKS